MPHKSALRLFHYTSSTGALGLVSGTARATMLQYMNDALEFTYALDLARSLIVEELGAATGGRDQNLCDEYLNIVRSLGVCAFCLSEDGDLLSQWRSYCPPEGGYAMGFATGPFGRLIERQGFKLVKCIYDVDQQIALLRPVIRELLNTARGLPVTADAADLKRLAPAALAEVGAALKHPSFAEEREWRVVGIPESRDLKFRSDRGLLIPYCEFQVAEGRDSYIAHSIVGPHRHPQMALNSLRQASHSHSGAPFTISISKSPFRVL